MPAFRVLCACALPLLVACADDSIAINLTRLREDPDDFALLDEATALVGLTWHESDHRRAVFLTLVDGTDEDDVCGVTTLHAKACTKVVTSRRVVQSIAHELAACGESRGQARGNHAQRQPRAA